MTLYHTWCCQDSSQPRVRLYMARDLWLRNDHRQVERAGCVRLLWFVLRQRSHESGCCNCATPSARRAFERVGALGTLIAIDQLWILFSFPSHRMQTLRGHSALRNTGRTNPGAVIGGLQPRQSRTSGQGCWEHPHRARASRFTNVCRT
jgi:hypothetical protein